MPDIGKQVMGQDIGLRKGSRYIWRVCMDCGKAKWTPYDVKRMKPVSGRCRKCTNIQLSILKKDKYVGERASHWHGGRKIDVDGYIRVYLYKTDFFYPMADKKSYVAEHRLIMAKYLGRCLHSWELVHHKNGIKDDNRIENLELTVRNGHIQSHNKGYRDGFQQGLFDGRAEAIKQLQARVTQLEAELVLVQALMNRGARNPPESFTRGA